MTATETKCRPILFSAPMVRAILDGRKTQTRRIVKPQIEQGGHTLGIRWKSGWHANVQAMGSGLVIPVGLEREMIAGCPYGVPGDRMWVRETWRLWRQNNTVEYFATDPDPKGLCWKPSIHMRREHSRLTIEISAVHVERLQSITPADAEAEGVGYEDTKCDGECGATPCDLAVGAYRELWNRINGPGSWELNPWVWVISFKREVAQ